MDERAGSTVRNHGHPWRLAHYDSLSDLFAMQIKLRE